MHIGLTIGAESINATALPMLTFFLIKLFIIGIVPQSQIGRNNPPIEDIMHEHILFLGRIFTNKSSGIVKLIIPLKKLPNNINGNPSISRLTNIT